MTKIIVITGPTATGKTAFALKLAKRINGELISADSRQIYKGLDIVTGKDIPKKAEFYIDKKLSIISSKNVRSSKMVMGYYLANSIPIWLYDVVSLREYFSSYDFARMAREVITDILTRDKTPIVIGGSYLYIKHLIYGLDTDGIPPNWIEREKLKDSSVTELFEILKSIDLKTASVLNQSDKNNPHRLMRKIELAEYHRHSGKPKAHPESQGDPGQARMTYPLGQFIGLKFKNKEALDQLIRHRVEERIKAGAIEEIKQLLEKGYSKSDPGLCTIGAKQIIDYLSGKTTFDEMESLWTTAETQYAGRQMTFMKTDQNIKWQIVKK